MVAEIEQKLKLYENVLVYAPGKTGVYRVTYIKKLPLFTLDLKTQIVSGASVTSVSSLTIGNEYPIRLTGLIPELPTEAEKKYLDFYLIHANVDVIDPMTLVIKLSDGRPLYNFRGNEFHLTQKYGMRLWTMSVFPGREETISILGELYPLHTKAARLAVDAYKYGVKQVKELTEEIDSFDAAIKYAAENKLNYIIPFYPKIYRMDIVGREIFSLPVSTSFTVTTTESEVLPLPFPSGLQYSFSFVRVTSITIANESTSAVTVTLSDNLDATDASRKDYKFEVEAGKTLTLKFENGIDFYGGIRGVADANVNVSIEGYYW